MVDWFGFLNIDKPAGWSSRRAVDAVVPLVKPAKVGHAGTLDPLATGVLVVCVGPATRLVPYLHQLPKSYIAEFQLGVRSPTDDTEGDVETIPGAPRLTRDQIEAAIPEFVGQIAQIPPAYSAVKVRGRRAYTLARRGQVPALEPRQVEVQAIRLRDFEPSRMVLEINCGSGTYIRSIGRDLAQSLGSSAVMNALTRTAIGPFTLAEAFTPDTVTAATLADRLTPPQTGLPDLATVVADDETLDRLRSGLRCACPLEVATQPAQEVAVLSTDHQLTVIATVVATTRELQPRHVLRPKGGRC